jgi:hypothetical protein
MASVGKARHARLEKKPSLLRYLPARKTPENQPLGKPSRFSLVIDNQSHYMPDNGIPIRFRSERRHP